MAFTKGHALVIGVGAYQNASDLNVPVAVADAEAVANLLKDEKTCGYPSKQVTLLTDAEANRAGILAALDQLAAKTQPEDTVFLFYCGHGAPGDDNQYYLISSDARVTGERVNSGTGVSGPQLIQKLAAIKARRVLVMMNACYSGYLSPHLGLGAKEFPSSNPPEDTANAILGSGQGRIIITAARKTQRAYVGKGKLSIFTQAMVDGLRGAAGSQNGFIGVYRLYEYLYEAIVKAVREEVNMLAQEPELTVLQGVGPFPVSLYKGSKTFSLFDENEPAPRHSGVVPVSQDKADESYRALIQQTGRVNQINQGSLGGSIVGGNQYNAPVINVRDVKGNMEPNYGTHIDTGGGAFIRGNVNTGGGDFVGRDQIKNVYPGAGSSQNELTELFKPLLLAAQSVSPAVVKKVYELQNEVAKGSRAADTKTADLISEIAERVPGAGPIITDLFNSPLLAHAIGRTTKLVLRGLD